MSVRWVPVDEVLERVSDPVEIDPERAYPYVGVRSFGKGLIRYPAVPARELSKLSYFSLADDVLIISNIKAWEGAVAVVEGVDDGTVVSSRFLTYRSRAGVDLRYVYHYFASAAGTDALATASPGSADRNRTLGRQRFESIRVPLPDLPTQRAIAARLDAVAIVRDEIGDRVGRRPRVSAIAPEAVGRALAALDLPDVPLASFYSIVGDVVRPEDDPREADRFVGLEHVTRDTGNRTGSSGVADRKGRKLRFAAGDVLYGYLRPYLNKVWVADGPGLCSVEQYVLRPADGVDPRLLGHVLRQQPTLDAVNAATHNLQLPRIRTALLGAIRVPDIRRAPPGTAEALDDINARSSQLAELVSRSGDLVDSLLPAARNEEFALLLAT